MSKVTHRFILDSDSDSKSEIEIGIEIKSQSDGDYDSDERSVTQQEDMEGRKGSQLHGDSGTEEDSIDVEFSDVESEQIRNVLETEENPGSRKNWKKGTGGAEEEEERFRSHVMTKADALRFRKRLRISAACISEIQMTVRNRFLMDIHDYHDQYLENDEDLELGLLDFDTEDAAKAPTAVRTQLRWEIISEAFSYETTRDTIEELIREDQAEQKRRSRLPSNVSGTPALGSNPNSKYLKQPDTAGDEELGFGNGVASPPRTSDLPVQMPGSPGVRVSESENDAEFRSTRKKKRIAPQVLRDSDFSDSSDYGSDANGVFGEYDVDANADARASQAAAFRAQVLQTALHIQSSDLQSLIDRLKQFPGEKPPAMSDDTWKNQFVVYGTRLVKGRGVLPNFADLVKHDREQLAKLVGQVVDTVSSSRLSRNVQEAVRSLWKGVDPRIHLLAVHTVLMECSESKDYRIFQSHATRNVPTPKIDPPGSTAVSASNSKLDIEATPVEEVEEGGETDESDNDSIVNGFVDDSELEERSERTVEAWDALRLASEEGLFGPRRQALYTNSSTVTPVGPGVPVKIAYRKRGTPREATIASGEMRRDSQLPVQTPAPFILNLPSEGIDKRIPYVIIDSDDSDDGDDGNCGGDGDDGEREEEAEDVVDDANDDSDDDDFRPVLRKTWTSAGSTYLSGNDSDVEVISSNSNARKRGISELGRAQEQTVQPALKLLKLAGNRGAAAAALEASRETREEEEDILPRPVKGKRITRRTLDDSENDATGSDVSSYEEDLELGAEEESDSGGLGAVATRSTSRTRSNPRIGDGHLIKAIPGRFPSAPLFWFPNLLSATSLTSEEKSQLSADGFRPFAPDVVALRAHELPRGPHCDALDRFLLKLSGPEDVVGVASIVPRCNLDFDNTRAPFLSSYSMRGIASESAPSHRMVHKNFAGTLERKTIRFVRSPNIPASVWKHRFFRKEMAFQTQRLCSGGKQRRPKRQSDAENSYRIKIEEKFKEHEKRVREAESKSDLETRNQLKALVDIFGDMSEECFRGAALPHSVASKLYNHQLDGIRFLFQNLCIKTEHGCILAHAMGLGKTIQIAVFCCLFTNLYRRTQFKDSKRASLALDRDPAYFVVVPASTVENWSRELTRWCRTFFSAAGAVGKLPSVVDFRNLPTRDRLQAVRMWAQQSGGFLICTYALYRQMFNKEGEPDVTGQLIVKHADLVVLDEGHQLKNQDSKNRLTLATIKTSRKVILTGYPLQNKIDEYWTMIDFVAPTMLGSYGDFSARFGKSITFGMQQRSGAPARRDAVKKLRFLQTLLYATVQRRDQSVFQSSELQMPSKTEFLCRLYLSKLQASMYSMIAAGAAADSAEDASSRSKLLPLHGTLLLVSIHPVYALVRMKHVAAQQPQLQRGKADKRNADDAADSDEDNVSVVETRELPWLASFFNSIKDHLLDLENGQKASLQELWSAVDERTHKFAVGSRFEEYNFDEDLLGLYKIQCALSIVRQAKVSKDKVLIFSQYHHSLEVIADALVELGWRRGTEFVVCTGSTPSTERDKIVTSFNSDSKMRVFLGTVKAMGIGVNLQAANRVVLLDLSHNPMYDNQAMCRAYRIGQKKACFVYMFVAKGTTDEYTTNRHAMKRLMTDAVVDHKHNKSTFEEYKTEKISSIDSRYILGDEKQEKMSPERIQDAQRLVSRDRFMESLWGDLKDKVCEISDYDSLLCDEQLEDIQESEQQEVAQQYDEMVGAIPIRPAPSVLASMQAMSQMPHPAVSEHQRASAAAQYAAMAAAAAGGRLAAAAPPRPLAGGVAHHAVSHREIAPVNRMATAPFPGFGGLPPPPGPSPVRRA
eukprot:ANDGO_03076.mRNA.1 Transcriptional regulator ATRX homolog